MTDREPSDVAKGVKEWLKADLAPVFPELLVALELPAKWALHSAPVLVIADDGDPMGMWPVATSPAIRITSWTSGRDRTYANKAMSRLLTKGIRIPGIKILRGTGILDSRDPKTNGDLSSFTVRTRARTVVAQ